MGCYPSADLVYGVDLGDDEDWDATWYTEELEEEHDDRGEAAQAVLKAAGLTGVNWKTYGNHVYDYTLSALTTRSIHATAYDAKTVTAEMLQVPDTDTELLKKAWELVGPGTPMPEPRWFIVVSYG